ncbi:nucleotidyltransferase domain-containing protein [Candidatus Poribacteria bacterium]|jgi:hypothetical protein|nr:nucleotidyltransferase domain-containing protein [Candidatus Poribacteria bacterium]MBT5533581.1 nucleotidyltransferase domain-containing protein [Candidatus Poribacteria bacterium]MBT5712107.1 nucleotidyltransferase domain-containing protein [Candidatus Poribacteria bacterium]MBT7098656.1 nucleotidyltransferase domain-containing protein [Candidatus Poribacteria bacterium]MBT7803870.1 nucleotidyltransferase domain-containing protein [Candidatus Poribacteria bacterium]
MPLPDAVPRFRDAAVAAFGGRVQCLLLTGSHARGDAHASSDIDMWLLLDEVSPCDLRRVAEIIASIPSHCELNIQCISTAEMQMARGAFEPVQFHLDGIVLHGDLSLPPLTDEDVRGAAARIGAEVLMGCRHYITAREAEAALADGKLRTWVLKPLMWALRYEAYGRLGEYPRHLTTLHDAAFSPDAQALVQTYGQMLLDGFEGVCLRVVDQAEAVARDLLRRVHIGQMRADGTDRPSSDGCGEHDNGARAPVRP